MKIEKSILGVAGEFAVAAELCRRNTYAQLTLGNQKGVDLLTLSQSGRLLGIEVKAKQGRMWPNQRGLPPGDGFLVFVDFAGRDPTIRPDFYVLSAIDWRAVADGLVKAELVRKPECGVFVDERNCPVFPKQIGPNGKPYRGWSIRVTDVQAYKEQWDKIEAACNLATAINKPRVETHHET